MHALRGGFLPRFTAKLMEHFNSPRSAGETEVATAAGLATRSGKERRVAIYLKVDGDAVTAVRRQLSPTAIVCLHDAQRKRDHAALAEFEHVAILQHGFPAASQTT